MNFIEDTPKKILERTSKATSEIIDVLEKNNISQKEFEVIKVIVDYIFTINENKNIKVNIINENESCLQFGDVIEKKIQRVFEEKLKDLSLEK